MLGEVCQTSRRRLEECAVSGDHGGFDMTMVECDAYMSSHPIRVAQPAPNAATNDNAPPYTPTTLMFEGASKSPWIQFFTFPGFEPFARDLVRGQGQEIGLQQVKMRRR